MTSSPGLRGWSHLQACHGVLQTPTYNDDRRRRQTPATITSLAPLVPTLCVGGPVIISSNRKKCVKNNIWLLLPSALLSLALFSKLLPFGPCFTKENLWGYVKQIFFRPVSRNWRTSDNIKIHKWRLQTVNKQNHHLLTGGCRLHRLIVSNSQESWKPKRNSFLRVDLDRRALCRYNIFCTHRLFMKFTNGNTNDILTVLLFGNN